MQNLGLNASEEVARPLSIAVDWRVLAGKSID